MKETTDYVTVDYLLSHGFAQYRTLEEGDRYQIPYEDNPGTLHFREIENDRQMFVVILAPTLSESEHVNGYSVDVYVQEDAGCGFLAIPFPWWDLPIAYFESVYYGIRGHKPKSNLL